MENTYTFNVNEIFLSIEGEGIRAGKLCTFVRFNGCNLRCKYCDTGYALRFANENPKNNTEYSLDNLIAAIMDLGCKTVTLTGGEPLAQPGIYILVDTLASLGYKVNIETNGSIKPRPHTEYDTTIYTMDYKSLSSGENDKMNIDNFKTLESKDVIKFVVGTKADLIDAFNFMSKLNEWIDTNVELKHPNYYFSPIFNNIEPSDIVEFMKEHKLYDARIQLQLHKFIWPPEMRGV